MNTYTQTHRTDINYPTNGGRGGNILGQNYEMINETYVSNVNLLPIWVNSPEQISDTTMQPTLSNVSSMHCID